MAEPLPVPAPRPVVLATEPEAIVGLFHAPAAGSPNARTAVLLCSPWGWEEVASHRSRRQWAEHLAAAGHPTLRFDLPATGDSSGEPDDPGRCQAWTSAVAGAAAWLHVSAGCERVSAIGLGLGGLLAGLAAADGAQIDDLVLWAAPTRGRAFVRTERAFARMQSSLNGRAAGTPSAAALPDGWLEAGGFALSVQTLEQLEQLDLAATPLGRLRRVLMLDRDGVGVDELLAQHLRDCGVETTIAPGTGWGAMVVDPALTTAPTEVFERVSAWLSAGEDTNARHDAISARATAVPATRDELALRVGDVAIRERAVTIETPDGPLFGLLCEPAAPTAQRECTVFLSAGAVRHIGPNRLYTELARRSAARGIPSLRVDLAGIGESDGDSTRFAQAAAFHAPPIAHQVIAILDGLEARGVGSQFILSGLCAGGYWAFQAAARDERVTCAVLLNPGALIWDDDLLTRQDARSFLRLLQPIWWWRILRGQVTAERMLSVLRSLTTPAGRMALRRLGQAGQSSTGVLDKLLDGLRESGTRVVLAFSEDENLAAELTHDGVFARLERWPNVALAPLPARDHTLRPAVAQRAVHELMDAELKRALGGAVGAA